MAKAATKTKTVQAKGKRLQVKNNQPHAKLDTGKVLKLHIQGKSNSDIARLYKVSQPAVSKAIAPYKERIAALGIYQDNKATFQDLAANRMLQGILEKDMDGEKLSSLSSAYKILNESHRLESGQSTSNISLKVVDLTQFSTDNSLNESDTT